jgi:hypothetical protein
LAGETETGRHAGHDGRDEVVEISVRGGVEFQGAETDVVEGLVVDTERLVRVLDELLRVKLLYGERGGGKYMDGQGGVVRLDDSVRHLRGRHDGKRGHHSVRVLLTNLADQESPHTCAGTSSKRVRYLEPLETITRLGLTSHNVQNLVN